jgi:Ca2+-binding EF-hand superfamily protein
MTRKQFISQYKYLCPKGDAERFARHVFRAFDTDKSNTVDFHEFLIGLSMTSSTSSPETKLEWTFHVFDIDGNGLLTRRECLEVIESIVRFNQSLQGDTLNINTDQIINSAKRSMMKIFDNVQDSRTDKLTMSQFVQGCLKDEFISQLLAPCTNTGDSSLTTT